MRIDRPDNPTVRLAMPFSIFHLLVPVFFPEFRVTVIDAVPKEVSCESCGRDYVYLLARRVQRQAGGLLGTQADAEASAETALRKALGPAVDPVPCPSCGWYQRLMVREARRRWGRGLLSLSLVLLVLGSGGLPLALAVAALRRGGNDPAGLLFLALTAACLVLAAVLPAGRFVLSQFHNPNAHDGDLRIRLGQNRAISQNDYRAGVRPPLPPLPRRSWWKALLFS